MDDVSANRVFHDHECHYYDERFAIVHDGRSARRARREVESLLGRALRPGEVVLDNTMGSGTTGVACVNTGRRFIGIERDLESSV